MPQTELVVVHMSGPFRQPVVRRRHYREHGPRHQNVVEVSHYKIGVVILEISRHDGEHQSR